jgi:glycosyltransferase involved in cell wall biosynthesis
MVQTKKVLVITFSFPPMPQVASLRMKGLAKYLVEFGWEPVFLSASPPNDANSKFRNIYVPYNENRLRKFLKSICFKRKEKQKKTSISAQRAFAEYDNKFSQEIVNWFNSIVTFPDHYKSWGNSVTKEAMQIVRTEKISAMISTSPPVTTNFIAAKLKSLIGLPWIADFRDLWSQNPYYPYNKLRKQIDRKFEKRVLARADALVTISEPLVTSLMQLHKGKRITTITNGFDPDEKFSSDLTKKFTIVYAGKFYQGKRDPGQLFKVLKELLDENIVNKRNLQVDFYGQKLAWIDNLIKKNCLESVVTQCGFIHRDVVMSKQRESQLLLLLNGSSEEERGIYTGKVFEYLAAQRPILYVGGIENDVISRLLQETNTGVRAQNSKDLKNIISKWYSQYLKKGAVSYEGKMEKINKYSHREMARKFADLLEEVSNKNHY